MTKFLRPKQIATLTPSEYIEYFHCTLADNNHVQGEVCPHMENAYMDYGKAHKPEVFDHLKTFAAAPKLQAEAEKLPGLDAIRKARYYIYTLQQDTEYYIRSACNGDLDAMDDYNDDITELYTALHDTAIQAYKTLQDKYPLTVAAENISKSINGNISGVQYYRIRALDAVLHDGNYQEWLDKAAAEYKKALDTE